MISKILYKDYNVYWMIFHLLLGIVSAFSPVPLILFFYIVLISELPKLFSKSLFLQNQAILFCLSYLVSFELLARMAQTSPFIPYELGKYLMLMLLSLGIIYNRSFVPKGALLLLLLLPALFYGLSNEVTLNNKIFNIIGPVNASLAVIYFGHLKISKPLFIAMLRLLLFPLICVLAFIIFKTPDFDKIDFALGANFETSGNFGSNQVSTVIGIGAFLTFIFWVNKWPITKYKWVDIALQFAFIFQGLLTFSRGGMLGAALAIIIVIYYISTASRADRFRFIVPALNKYLIVVVIVCFGAFFVADRLTGGNLSLRYQGETAGTLAGTKVKDLNTITTNRTDIFTDDYNLWRQYPVLGVGVGGSKYLRDQNDISNSHIELSRLLAEHGIPGAIFFVILLSLFFNIRRKNPNPVFKAISVALFLLAIYTTFHAAIRTYVTPLLLGFSLIGIMEHKPPSIAASNDK